MKKKISLVVPFVLAFIATILFLVDVALDSSRTILIGLGAILTIFWIAYALVLRRFTKEGENILENLAHKYEGKLSETEWTKVYLKQDKLHEKSVIGTQIEGENVSFYAKIQPNNNPSIWNDHIPHILIATVKEGEWISDSAPIQKFGVKGFEEYFSLEK